ITQANEQGVDPQLALAVAKVESGFSQAAKSNKGAVGVMQLLPSTAKGLGVNPKNMDDNIRGGVMYLKEMLDLSDGDVRKALVAYNGGPRMAKMENPPNMEYADLVNSIYPFDSISEARRLNQMLGGSSPAQAMPASTAPAESDDPIEIARRLNQQLNVSNTYEPSQTGARALQQRRFDQFQEAQRAARARDMAAIAEGLSPGEKWARKITGYVKPGVETVAEAATDYRRGFPQGKITSGKDREPSQLTERLIERSRNAPIMGESRPVPEPQGEPPRRPGGRLGSVIKGSTMGALGGLGAGYSGYEAKERFEAGDYPGAAISGLGALGGIAAMAPHPMIRYPGLAIEMAAPVAIELYDRYLRDRPSVTFNE
ncbi:MAG: hypothetical protein EB069_10410, partial [Actinobacteria bacterium]|nr:hypothetical protein [Actinomycetota bacterium]